ncbi:MAG: hypothetical protein AB2A00_09270 [Myxococcota bacterium]
MRAGAMVWMVLGVAGAACPGQDQKPQPQRTQVAGSVFRRSFPEASAAFSEQTTGNTRSVIIRVTNRPDTCEAVHDPSDVMDPSLLVTITPDQTGKYPVVDPANPPPAQYASATLLTYTDLPDGGVPDGGDAGLQPVLLHATAGEVEVTDYVPGEDGVLNASVVLVFGDAGYVGKLGATGCDRVR